MKNLFVRFGSAALLPMCLIYVNSAAQETQEKSEAFTLQPLQRSEIEAFLQRLPDNQAVRKDIALFKRTIPGESPLSGQIYLKSDVGNSQADISITFDVKKSKVVSYFGPYKDSAHDTKISPLTNDKAFEIARPILDYYGLSGDLDEYSIELVLDEHHILVAKDLELNGVPCPQSRIWIIVPPEGSGSLSVQYSPCSEPAERIVNFSPADAVSVGLLWLQQHWYFGKLQPTLPPDALTKCTEVIAVPNHFSLTESAYRAGLESTLTKTSAYCWSIPFSCSEYGHEFEGHVFVDIATGKVIAADS